MLILVRCPDQSVTVAVKSRLAELINEGLITEYLGARGWVRVSGTRRCVRIAVSRRAGCPRQLSCL